MKKFLTVLLVIAVMFTFSFGSAMAATDADDFTAAVAKYKNGLSYDGYGYLTTSEAPYVYWAGKIVKPVLEGAIDAWAADFDLTADGIVDANGNLTVEGDMITAIIPVVDAAQYNYEAEAFNAYVASIDLTAYTEAAQATIKSAIQSAENTVAGYTTKNVPNAVLIKAEKTTLAGVVKAQEGNLLVEQSKNLAETLADLRITLADESDDYYAFAKPLFAANPTTAVEVAYKASFDADFAALVDYFAACIDRYEEEVLDEETPFVAANTLKANIQDYFTESAVVNDPSEATSYFQKAVGYLNQNDVFTAHYEKAAAGAKAALNADGTKKYYDVDVDNLLADTKDALANDLWNAFVTAGTFGTTANTTWTNGLAAIEGNVYGLQDYRTAAVEDITTGDYALTEWSWSEERADKVEAIQDDYSEKILLAATIDEIDDLVEAAQDAMDLILNNDEVEDVADDAANRIVAAGYLTTCEMDATYVEEVATATGNGFSAYFDVVVGPSTVYSSDIKEDALKAAAQVFVDAVIAAENADISYKAIDEIIKANKEAAYAALTGVKTTAELKAEAAAVTDLIKAFPTKITVADKAQVLEAQAAMDAYLDLAGGDQTDVAKHTTLENALVTVFNAENREVLKLVRALPTVVTVADAEKIEAARAAYDALVETYEDYVGTDLATGTSFTSEEALLTAETRLETAKLNNTAKLIAALTPASTAAEVEAAKAAFEGLETASKLALNDQLYAKLMDAVKAAEADAKVDAEEAVKDAIASVEGLKITAKSSAKKGAITVKWTVEGDDANVQYYEVRKSTKKNSGFGTKPYFTTTKMTYKNTKGLEAGTRYYFKVRAVAEIDGEVYVSDWSNKAYRVAK